RTGGLARAVVATTMLVFVVLYVEPIVVAMRTPVTHSVATVRVPELTFPTLSVPKIETPARPTPVKASDIGSQVHPARRVRRRLAHRRVRRVPVGPTHAVSLAYL